jgi:hypothetical protein
VGGRLLEQHAAVVAGKSGRPLDSAIRALMQQRFQYDFSRVRIHTDPDAAESARAAMAKAYTVGNDIVFGAGAYAPDHAEGRRLLAHELAHVLQADPTRATGGGAVEPDAEQAADAIMSTSGPVRPGAFAPVGALLRQEAGAPQPEPAAASPPLLFDRPRLLDQELQPPKVLAEQPPLLEPPALEPLRLTLFVEPVVELAVERLQLALNSLSGAPDIAKAWPHVVAQVRSPRTRPPKDAPPELYEPGVVAVIKALTPDPSTIDQELSDRRKEKLLRDITTRRKAEVLERVFLALLTATEKQLGSGVQGRGDPEREWAEDLETATKKQIGKTAADYREVRSGLLGSFGALEVGTAEAITRMNAFYQDKIVRPTFLGKKVWVHTEMRDRLAKATAKLDKAEQDAIARELSSVGGVSIRPNANNPLVMSKHSFGAAIDLNAETNPNVPDFPERFVSEVTGVDLMVTPGGRRKTDVFDLGKVLEFLGFGQKDPALEELERLVGASKQLVKIFKDDTSLAGGMRAVARRMGASRALPTPDILLAAVRAARDEGSKVSWRYQDPKAKLPRRAPQGLKHDALARMLFPPGTMVGPESLEDWNHKRHTVELLIQMADVYERSFAKDKKGRPIIENGRPKRVEATGRAEAGVAALPQLVAHGFLDLPPRLVSALRAPDGGGLTWLGTSEHSDTRDFMHFELKGTIPAILGLP